MGERRKVKCFPRHSGQGELEESAKSHLLDSRMDKLVSQKSLRAVY